MQTKFGTFAASLLLGLILATPAALAEALSLQEVQKMAATLDGLLEKDLLKKKQAPLPLVSDGVFVRRAYLGVVGRIPTAQEALSFLENTSENKRSLLIEKLVASPGYESHAFNYYADLLRLDSTKDQHGLGWHVYLRKAIAEDKPYDQLVHEMLSSEGHTARNPAVGYYLRDRGMILDNVSNTMQVFLGHQIGCAQCHDHPFDTWTQMEYYELAAFSGGLEYRSAEAKKAVSKVVHEMRSQGTIADNPKGGGKKNKKRKAQNPKGRKVYREFRNVFRYFQRNEVSVNDQGTLKLPEDYQYEDGDPGEVIEPATLFGDKLKNTPSSERREAFAGWVTSGNDYFAKVIANRLWGRTFGRGLVEPMDDWSNNATSPHPEVMDALGQLMEHVDYQTREFERVLYHTKLFQREVTATETARGFGHTFTGPHLRRLSAEQMYDSFLVLNFGNVDDKINTALEKKWNSYQESTINLIESSPKELLAYRDQANKAEADRLARQRELRAIQGKINAANKRKDYDMATSLRRELGLIRRKYLRKGSEMMVFQRNTVGRAKPAPNMRASEYPTPFKGNHFVRLFGGSDRNTPESSHTQASTPQALALLNGPLASRTENRRSKVFEALSEITNAETRLEYLFLAFYGDKPTPEEVAQFLPIAENRDDIFSLARAMLTTKRFLFIQ